MNMHLRPAGRHSDKRDRQAERWMSAVFVFGRYVAVGVLFLLFLLLGEAMVHHRFADGGWVNRNGTIRP